MYTYVITNDNRLMEICTIEFSYLRQHRKQKKVIKKCSIEFIYFRQLRKQVPSSVD